VTFSGTTGTNYTEPLFPGVYTVCEQPVARSGSRSAALNAYSVESKRTWLLWAVLLLAAVGIIAMVLRLLKASPEQPQ